MRPKGIYSRRYSIFLLLAVLALASLPGEAFSGETEVLLLSCMDYRLLDETERYMAKRGLRNKYDHVILAGAALGATIDQYPSWNQTFWDHIAISIKLHHIKKVIVLDHRDCGAYKEFLGKDFAKHPDKEKSVHTDRLSDLARQIKDKYPGLEIELHLMDLSGKVEDI